MRPAGALHEYYNISQAVQYIQVYKNILVVCMDVRYCSSSCAGWPNFGAGSMNLIPVFSFSSIKRDLFLMHPLAVLILCCIAVSIFLHSR